MTCIPNTAFNDLSKDKFQYNGQNELYFQWEKQRECERLKSWKKTNLFECTLDNISFNVMYVRVYVKSYFYNEISDLKELMYKLAHFNKSVLPWSRYKMF